MISSAYRDKFVLWWTIFSYNNSTSEVPHIS